MQEIKYSKEFNKDYVKLLTKQTKETGKPNIYWN